MRYGAMRYELVEVGADARVYAIPVIEDGWPPELKSAIALRREATITGRCRCGASLVLPNPAPVGRGRIVDGVIQSDPGRTIGMAHENDCPASDEHVVDLLLRYGIAEEER